MGGESVRAAREVGAVGLVAPAAVEEKEGS